MQLSSNYQVKWYETSQISLQKKQWMYSNQLKKRINHKKYQKYYLKNILIHKIF